MKTQAPLPKRPLSALVAGIMRTLGNSAPEGLGVKPACNGEWF